MKKWIVVIGFGILSGCQCPAPLPECEAKPNSSTWSQVETCYDLNLKTIRKYNASLDEK
jgi:hypothetical protein